MLDTHWKDNTEDPRSATASDLRQGPMELLYIWINRDETGFVKEQGFNFSPNYRFEMKACGDGVYELYCTENPNYPNVWKTGNIVNLTAVVGENGSGKSSLLRHLTYASVPFINRDTGRVDGIWRRGSNEYGKMVQVHRNNNAIVITHNFRDGKLLNKIEHSEVVIFRKGASQADMLPGSQSGIYMTNARTAWNPVRRRKTLAFSPDMRTNYSSSFYRKTSGQHMADELPERFQILQESLVERKRSEDFENLLAISYYHHLHSAGVTHVPLFADNKEITVYIPEPCRAFLLADKNGRLHLDQEQYSAPLSDLLNAYVDLVKSSLDKASLRLDEIFQDAMAFEILTWLGDVSLDQKRMDILRSNPCAYLEEKTVNSECLKEYYRSAVEEVRELVSILRGCEMGTKFALAAGEDVWWVKLKPADESYHKFCEFVDRKMREKFSFTLKYLQIEMPMLSSGELALRNIFSWLRLPPSFDKILGEESVPIQDNILLLLDETDLYMHPEWQRKFLKYLSDELALEYPNKHIQIIISTHSPLVLSDIPSGNIIYLEKNDEKCTVVQRSEQMESFGANIFSLLKDSFFLKRSLGEFAYSKISAIIEDLEKLKKNRGDQELRERCKAHRPLIDIIGEPVLRRKLQMMHDDIFGSDDKNPDELALERVEQLLKRDSAKYRERLMKMLSDAESQ